MKKHFLYCWLCLGIAVLASCKKYPELPSLHQPAYLRVFNDLNYVLGPANSTLPSNEITFLFDPVFDKSGLPTGASIVGDYITVRDTFSTSYPAGAGNIAVTDQAEWPGSATVLTAPTINGFDLSSWAQVPSGKHRIMLMGRPQTDTPFVNLPASGRGTIIADTTVDLTAGEVYTLEAALFDEAANITGAYLRQENFPHTAFTTQNNYLSFYDLSAKNLNPNNGLIYIDPNNITHIGTPFFTPLDLYYTVYTPICANSSATGVISYSCAFQTPTAYQVYFRTLNSTFETDAPYDSIPVPPLAQFLNPDSTFADPSSRPWVSIAVHEAQGSPCSINFGVDTAAWGRGAVEYSVGVQSPAFEYGQGLTIATSNSQKIAIYPSINIIEIINSRPYVIQIHRTFDPPIISN
ncbi:MAG TPA: hypothetical protein VGS79_28020 [Puia sp.]|nr:hypothetical protein [Puia sp.]